MPALRTGIPWQSGVAGLVDVRARQWVDTLASLSPSLVQRLATVDKLLLTVTGHFVHRTSAAATVLVSPAI